MADYKYSSHHNEHPLIKNNIFIKLMDLSTQGMLLYHNKLYQHVDDAAMGCPLVPTMANFLLERMETIMLKKLHPKMCVRCMDDIFAIDKSIPGTLNSVLVKANKIK